jgi:hypothetical protein
MSSNEYHRQWRANNPDKVLRASRRFRAVHLDEERRRNLRYYYEAKAKDPRLVWARHSLKGARARAIKRGVPFAVELAHILELPADRCPVSLCGHRELNFGGNSVPRRDSPTLDRIDPLCGYVPGNLWIVCFDCNRRMAENTAEELEELARAKRLARQRPGGGSDG